MLDQGIEEALNRQLVEEYYSAWLYFAMSGWAESQNYLGMAHWLACQAAEERAHGKKIFDYILSRGGKIRLTSIREPKNEWNSALELFQDAFSNEQKVTAGINLILTKAREAQDCGTIIFLHYFVTEQIEEEAQTERIVQELEKANACFAAFLLIDSCLGKRQE